MSDPEEDEDDMPDDKDSTHSGEGNGEGEGEGDVVVADVVVVDVDRDGDGETHGEDEEEDSSDDFFDPGECAVIAGNRLSLRAASESGQSSSGGGTGDDPISPVTVTPRTTAGPTAAITHNKPTLFFIKHDLVSFKGP